MCNSPNFILKNKHKYAKIIPIIIFRKIFCFNNKKEKVIFIKLKPKVKVNIKFSIFNKLLMCKNNDVQKNI